MALKIRLAQKNEYKLCTEIVQHAFRNYPFFQIFVDDIDKRQKFNEAILDIWCAACDSLPSPKWHLCLLAVSEAQKGYGSQMLHRGVEPYIAKRGGGSLVFNTNAEINRKFYSKNGFEEFASESFPANGKILGNWSFCLKIEPQT